MKIPSTLTAVKNTLVGDGVYRMVTIKPPRGSSVDVLRKVLDYFKNKGFSFWIVKVRSPHEYIHYHGIIRKIHPHTDYKKTQTEYKSIHRQMNRLFGFYTCRMIEGDIDGVYKYIMNQDDNLFLYQITSDDRVYDSLESAKSI